MRSRTKSILIRLTPEELESVNKKAESAKLPREKFCRMILSGAQLKEAPPVEFYTLITEVRRVGVHLNQIIRKANSLGLLDVPLIRNALDELHETQAMLYKTFQHERT